LEQGNDFGTVQILSGKKVLIEHSSPNLFKPFHIGHMMNNAIGESLVRLFRVSGAHVSTMSFPSDISLGIAKAIFVLLEKYGADFNPVEISVLGDAYVTGTQRYDSDESVHGRVKEIADNLYTQKPSPEWDVFQKCKKFNINYFESIVVKLGSHFDSYIYESEAGVQGKEIVLNNVPDVFTKSEGAIVYIPVEEKKNINTAVFINSQGNPTYEAKDIGLLDLKFSKYHPDLSIFVTDHEQVSHFNVVLDAAGKINSTWVNNSRHVPHGRMSFQGQKMSSRLGNTPLVTDMLDMVLEEVNERSGDRAIDNITKESIAIGAIKFAILRAKPGMNINFDPETSLSFEGDSGPYLQYTHARIASLLEKAAVEGLAPKYNPTPTLPLTGEGENTVTETERLLYRLPELVERAIAEYAPNYIVTYLLEIARSFNSFYTGNKIVDLENRALSEHRIIQVFGINEATQRKKFTVFNFDVTYQFIKDWHIELR
jgi:arginyl-tRNA synthetase